MWREKTAPPLLPMAKQHVPSSFTSLPTSFTPHLAFHSPLPCPPSLHASLPPHPSLLSAGVTMRFLPPRSPLR
jgi:hypothetical protein